MKTQLNMDQNRAMKVCRRAIDQIERGNFSAAIPKLKKAAEINPGDPEILLVAVGTLIDIEEYELAIEILISSLQKAGQTPELLQLSGELCQRMEMYDIGAKFYSILLQLKPDEPRFYAEWAECLRNSGEPDRAVEVIVQAVEAYPDSARLWNTLGVLTLNHLNKIDDARHFFECATQIEPSKAMYWYNYATSIAHHPEFTETYLQKALELEPENPQINLTYGINKLHEGEIETGWKHYRFRHSAALGNSKVAHYDTPLPFWQGEKLENKRVLVCPEQGIGDEVLFAAAIPKLLEIANHVTICCEPRLVSIFKRSFPTADVVTYEDTRSYKGRIRKFQGGAPDQINELDVAIFAGDLLSYFLKTKEDLYTFATSYLISDPKYADEIHRVVPKIASVSRPKIGLSWRSGNTEGARAFHYLSLDIVQMLLTELDADFFVLQYAFGPEEREMFRQYSNISFFDGYDLKKDIEANLAIMDHLDLVIGPATATQAFAGAHGTPCYMINFGKPWTFFGQETVPGFWHQDGQLFDLGTYLFNHRPPDRLIQDVKAALENSFGLRT